MKTLKTAIVAATLSTAAIGVAPVAMADVEASATLSSSYLWRGQDLGKGDAALSADLVYSEGGFYGGLWLSSGDATAGTEFDYFAGYGGSVGSISYDIGFATYAYPTTDVDPGELSEVIISLGAGPVSVTLFDNVAGASGYTYTTVGYEAGDFAFTYGDDENYAHFDVSYAVNDSLSFTMSTIVDEGEKTNEDGTVVPAQTADTTFVASYSLPF
jgi:uncharacterized protein (TIGR02001 family)